MTLPARSLFHQVVYIDLNLGAWAKLGYGGGERGFPKNLFPLLKSTPPYRILHHTLIKYREMMVSIS
jgi:hypothetical protein